MDDAPKATKPLPPLPPPPRRDGTLPPTAEPDGQLHRPNSCSPYCLTIPELVARFGISRSRLDSLDGFLRFRAALRRRGFTRGYHWIGGSFVREGESPGDIDVTSFIHGSVPWSAEVAILHPDPFDPERVRRLYGCDVHFVDARAPSYLRSVIHAMHAYSAGDDSGGRRNRRLGFVEVTNVAADADAKARAVLAAVRRRVLGDADA
jgi:hypothetical protein